MRQRRRFGSDVVLEALCRFGAITVIAMLVVLLAVLAYAHIFRIVATEWKGLTNGAGGLSNIPRFPTVFGYDFASKTGGYWIVLSLVLAFVVLQRWIVEGVERTGITG